MDTRWDDSVIIDSFERSIRSHRLQHSEIPSSISNSSSSPQGGKRSTSTSAAGKGRSSLYDIAIGEPGPWEPVDTESSKRPRTSADSSSPVTTTVEKDLGSTGTAEELYMTGFNAAIGKHDDIYSFYAQSQMRAEFENTEPLDEALSSMLMAWYQSGYATGRYYTLLEVQKQANGHGDSTVMSSGQDIRDNEAEAVKVSWSRDELMSMMTADGGDADGDSDADDK